MNADPHEVVDPQAEIWIAPQRPKDFRQSLQVAQHHLQLPQEVLENWRRRMPNQEEAEARF